MVTLIVFVCGILVGHFGVSKIVAALKAEEQKLTTAPTITITAKK